MSAKRQLPAFAAIAWWWGSDLSWAEPIGPGTLAYALSIGPLTHVLLPRFTVSQPRYETRKERSKQL